MNVNKPAILAVALVLAAGAGYFAFSRKPGGSFSVAPTGAPVRTGEAVTTEQKLCVDKGKMLFEGSGYSDPPLKEFTAVYAAYYNPRVSHCYLAITSTYIENASTMVELFDADDKKLYGTYNVAPTADGKGTSIVACVMSTADGSEKPCTTPAEWTAFITSYMN